MITGFDIAVFLGVLFAMLASRMPKQFAMAVALGDSLIIMAVNYSVGHGDMLYWAVIAAELLSGLILVKALDDWRVRKPANRLFYRIMAGFFFVAALNHLNYLAGSESFEVYTQQWRVLAVLHVLYMIGASDGMGSLIRTLGLWGNHRSSGLPDTRR